MFANKRSAVTWVVVALSLGMALLVASTHAADQSRYLPTALTPQAVGDSVPQGMSANGAVVGNTDAADGWLHPFIWTAKEGMTVLDNPVGSEDCTAVAFNDSLRVVGQCINAGASDAGWRAYLWTRNGEVTPLESPEGAWACSPTSINDAGRVLGECEFESADHTSVAVVWAR